MDWNKPNPERDKAIRRARNYLEYLPLEDVFYRGVPFEFFTADEMQKICAIAMAQADLIRPVQGSAS